MTKIEELDNASKKIQSDLGNLLTEWLKYLDFEPPLNWIEQLTMLNTVDVTTEENAATQCACTLQLYKRMIDFLNLHNQVSRQVSEMSRAFHVIAMAQAELHNSGLDLTDFDFDKISKSDWGSLYTPPEKEDVPEPEPEPRPEPEFKHEQFEPEDNRGYGGRL